MKIFLALFCFLFINLSSVIGQDTLRLLNGNVMQVKFGDISESEISFRPQSAKRQGFQIRSKREIFSFQKQGEKEVIIYKYNPDIGNFYQVSEMREYMIGERHVDDFHKTALTKISAVAVGGVAGYLVSEGGGVILASPLVFSAIMMIPRAKIQENNYNSDLINKLPYRNGYRRVAKGKRFLNNLAYSTLGMIGSFMIFEYTK